MTCLPRLPKVDLMEELIASMENSLQLSGLCQAVGCRGEPSGPA